MTLSLDDLKKQYADQENKKTNYNSGEWYPFWKMDTDQIATIRFLPDGDPNASHFLKEKFMHKLEVTIDGKSETRNIPCLQMYGKRCPVCETAKKFYDEKDEENGIRFYKKRSWIGQVLVIESPFDYEEPEKIVKLISINKKINDSIKNAIMRGDLEHLPTDYNSGYNYRIQKTKTGKWADYSSSSFSPKASALDPDVVEGLELNILKDRLPKEPLLENVEAMLISALTGEPYVPIKHNADRTLENSAFATPDHSTTPSTEPVASETPASEAVSNESVPADDNSGGQSQADDILAQIAARKAAKDAKAIS